MKNIYWIRHGMTEGNRLKRYVGRTDEGLCEDGRELILSAIGTSRYPKTELVAVSPMKRCIETAELIYPGHPLLVVERLKECNFGDFEYKNHHELCNNSDYQAWIDSNGEGGFPNGESLEAFRYRCTEGFIDLMNCEEVRKVESISLVVHGGTVMSVLSKLCDLNKSYFDWMLGNGEGFYCTWDGYRLSFRRKLIGAEKDCH